jgi:hypothetical protein
MKNRLFILLCAGMVAVSTAAAAQKFRRKAVAGKVAAKEQGGATFQPVVTAFNSFKTAVDQNKSKADIQRMARELVQKVNAYISGYTGEATAGQTTRDADKERNAQEIKAAEKAWHDAELAVVRAQKENKSADEIANLQNAELAAKQAYDKRKGQHIIMGELREIIKL